MKDFFIKWKEGIEAITPYQASRITYHNTWIIILGIFAGLVISILNYKTLWWMGLILLGALGNTLVVQLGNWKKYKTLKYYEKLNNNEDANE